MENFKPVHVAVAVIENQQGEVLISRRPDHVHQGGLWEFPGGKVETGESIEAALQREIHEEIDLHIIDSEPLIKIFHEYPGKSVLLDVRSVRNYSGRPYGKENQPVKWVSLDALNDYDFPAANIPIIKALKLPHEYMITGEFDSNDQLFGRVSRAISDGIKLVQFRAHKLDKHTYHDLARELYQIIKNQGGKLLLNRNLDEYIEMDAEHYSDGIHLTSHEIKRDSVQSQLKNIFNNKLIAASVHDLYEMRLGQECGVDFCVLSPVKDTTSHPDAKEIGWNEFESIANSASVPIFALGGLSVNDMETARNHGAQGISGISLYWDVQ